MDRYDLQTDTHLSKDFNKVLQSLMFFCNQAKVMVESQPHYDYLQGYYASVTTLFNNSFFLFESLVFEGKNYTMVLMERMAEVRTEVTRMKVYPQYQTQLAFYKVLDSCNFIHMMIMSGLQQRKMLVRMSEKEPKGARSIEMWRERSMFHDKEIEYHDSKDGKFV